MPWGARSPSTHEEPPRAPGPDPAAAAAGRGPLLALPGRGGGAALLAADL